MRQYQHTVTFTVGGPQAVVHPQEDVDSCGFEAYLDTWADAMPFNTGPWGFAWVVPDEGDGYWNGTVL